MHKTISSKITALTFGVLVISFLTAFYVVAWQEPTSAPPSGNVSAPLNTGPTGQSKEGGLILNTGGAVTGLIIEQGEVCIGTECRSSWPVTGVITTYQMSASSYKVGQDTYSKSVSYSCPGGSEIVIINCSEYEYCGVNFCYCSSAGSAATLKAYAWKQIYYESSSGPCTGFSLSATDHCVYNPNTPWGMACSTVNCSMEFQCGIKQTVGD